MKKNRITFIFLFLLSIIFKYSFGGFVPSFFFNTLLTLLFASIGYTIYVYIRIKFIQDIEKRIIVKGESLKLIVKLYNEDFLIFPYVFVSFFGSHSHFNAESYSQSLAITPFSKKEFVFDMECKYRGQYEIGISDIYIEDFLGLIRLKYKIPETKKIIVYPNIVYLSKFDIFSNSCSDSQNFSLGIVEDVNNIKDLRNYTYGDSLRRIHWKQTAKNNQLMVKNYQSTTDVNLNILLDLRHGKYSEDINIIIEDKLIEAVISVVHYYLFKNVAINYIYFDQKLEVLKAANQAEFDLIYKTLSSVEFKQQVSLADIVKLHYESRNNLNDMIIFTSNLDIDLYNEIYNAQMSNHSICLIYVSPRTLVNEKNDIIDEILDNLPEIGVRAYTINPDDNLNAILGG
ncbi:DUF58 domain-containing protein [Ruminiclostridium herbifermentans]|uniref:DUF58 domain-containing protein n=1 Tax=Ruminiclostridium herbifermentans TaxID=2488810 RepID=A0A4U7JIL7_9FIRM|nr:DUF58 domain-containing protein [Ruminiclostridium herbifermentans]QNU65303.1 DUF58 domain-containing protein [Ruminiclostridium herbifermentans]